MKTKYHLLSLLFSFFLAGSNLLQAQCISTPFTESFDNGTQPTCILTSATSGGPWDFNGFSWNTSGCSPAPTDHTGNNGDFASMDHSATDIGVIMEFDTIDASATSNPYLEFYYFMCGSGYSPVNILAVEYHDGTTWQGIDTIQQGTNGWQKFSYNLTGMTFNTNKLKVRFRAESGGSSSDFYGDQAIDDISITQLPSCFPPLNLIFSEVEATSADVSWTDTSAALSYQVEYGVSGFTQGTGTDTIVTVDSITLSNLMPITTYDWYVRSICSIGDTSVWVGSSFTTTCPTYTPDYTENFSTFVPDCWNEASTGTPSTGPSGIGSGDWTGDDYLNNATNSNAAKVNLWNTGTSDWILSPEIDLSGTGPYELVIHAGITAFGSATTPESMGSDDTVQVLISTDNGISWTPILTWDTANMPTINGNQYIVDLSSYNSNTSLFGVWASEGTTDDSEDYDFFINDFTIRLPPNCPEPSNLTATVLNADSAKLKWTETGTSISWEVEYDTVGFTPGTGNSMLSASDSLLIGGLMSQTTYSWYVRSICGVGDTSAWSGPNNFTTPCGSFTPPYTEDFSTYLPNCWEEATGDLTSNTTFTSSSSDWTSDGFLNNGSSGSARMNIWSTSKNEWLISPSINLGIGTVDYRLEFDAGLTDFSGSGNDNMSSDDTLAIVISTDNGMSWSTSNLLKVYDTLNQPSNSGESVIIDLSSYTGTIKVGFYAQSEVSNTDYNVYIDNFVIREIPDCPEPTNMTTTEITANSAKFSWIEAGTALSWEVEYDTTGFTPGTGRFDTIVVADSVNISNLMSSTTYDWYVRAICGPGDTSVWSGPETFTTPCSQFMATYVQNFDNTSTAADFNNATVPCWQAIGPGANDIEVANSTDAAVTGTIPTSPNAVEFNDGAWPTDTSILVSPAFSGLNSGNNRIRMQVAFEDPDDADVTLYVGVLTDPNNTSTFTILDTIAPSDYSTPLDFNEYKLNLIDTAIIGNAMYIGIAHGPGIFEAYIDSFVYEPMPSCLAISNGRATSTTDSTATIMWDDPNGASQWQVEYGNQGFTVGSGMDTVVNSNPATLNGLAIYATYDFYVRSICGAGDSSLWSGPYTFTTGSPLSGIYTIDSSGSGNRNFMSFSNFANVINNKGVNGAVTVNVTANTYNDQFSLGNIMGSSSSNTVTIDGGSANNVRLIHDQSVRNSTVNLEGTSYTILKNMTIENTGTSDAWGIHIWDSAHHIRIVSNRILMAVGSNSDVAGIVATDSETSDISSGDNAFNLFIANNTLRGGEKGISIRGNFTSTQRNANLTLLNNTIFEVDDNGIYIAGYDSVRVEENYVDSTNSSTGDGLYASDLENFIISRNYFKGQDNGIDLDDLNYDNPVSTPSEISNNMFIGGR
jgi:hypothetical protein